MFSYLDSSVYAYIKVANGEKIMSIGTCNITEETSLGPRILRGVFLISKIDINIFSVGQLVKMGYKVLFDKKKALMEKEYNNIILILMSGVSFPLSWSTLRKIIQLEKRFLRVQPRNNHKTN